VTHLAFDLREQDQFNRRFIIHLQFIKDSTHTVQVPAARLVHSASSGHKRALIGDNTSIKIDSIILFVAHFERES